MSVITVTGIDDGYFPLNHKGRKGYAPLVSVIYEDFDLVEIDYSLILVDGEDATDKLRSMNKRGYVILDGVIFGGFNYVKPEPNWIVFYSKRPNIIEIERALLKHFSKDQDRIFTILNILKNLRSITSRKGTIYVYTSLELSEASRVISHYQIFSKRPEPLRTAHVIASAIGKLLF